MSKNGLEPVRDLDFTADATMNGRELRICLSGNADLNVKTHIDRFLSDVHDLARRERVAEVSVDVRGLEFMNSSCLKAFVRWINGIQDELTEAQYRIVFLSSPSMYWQRRSLNALACLASDIVSVQA
jgi:hypothetical protein